MSGTRIPLRDQRNLRPAVNSSCVALTVNTPTATSQTIERYPLRRSATSFTVAATGTTPSYQWGKHQRRWYLDQYHQHRCLQRRYNSHAHPHRRNSRHEWYQYRCAVNGATSCAASNSTAATHREHSPSITTQPVAATTLCAGNNVTYRCRQWYSSNVSMAISTTGAGGP